MKKLAVFIIAVFILAGCGKEPTEVRELPSSGNGITVAFSGEPEFQPHSADNRSMGFCLGVVYDPLWKIEKDGTLTPVLAEKIVSRGREVDIYIKEGIKWHDGDLFVPEDVVYTISLITGGESVYPAGIIGNSWVSGTNRITVSLKAMRWEPEGLFTFPVVKNGAPTHMKSPIGTGMYKYVGKVAFDTYLFEPFMRSELPPLKMIAVRDKVRETELFKAGITDLQFVENRDLSEYVPLKNSRVLKYPTKQIIYIGINKKNVSPYFRRGLFYALDIQQITEDTLVSRGKSVRVPYFSKDCFSYKCLFDNSMTRSELKAGGFIFENNKLFSGGQQVIMEIGVAEGHGDVALKVSETLSRMGAECVIRDINPNFADEYDIIIATGNTDGEPLASFLYENHMLSSEIEFNNAFFRAMPFIPVALRCHGVFYSQKYDEAEIEFPLIFW